MPADNIVKMWKLPNAGGPPVVDVVKGQERPWWFHFFNGTQKIERKKCPICLMRMCQVKTSKGEHSCADCAHLHFRTIRIDNGEKVLVKQIYLETKDILEEAAKVRRQLAESRSPGKKNH